MLSAPWIAALLALFLWWFSTGAILWRVRTADRAGDKAHAGSVLWSLPLLAAGLYGLWATRSDPTTTGVYLAFLSTLAVWGWIELSFLSGVITGPSRAPCPPDIRGPERFFRAWGTVAHHELLLALGLLVALALMSGAENAFGFWTYIILYAARISAKLNLFLGVPKINSEFLPLTLTHLDSHFRKRPVGWFFPVSVSLLSFAVACWLKGLWTAPDAPAAVGFALLSTITALAVLEHWFMVLPLPDEKLWRWMIPGPSWEEKRRSKSMEEGPPSQ
ncbi:MAG: putative photosynthetic complex assembly protein PuhE [Pseudomonadota bacterium]